MGLLDDAIREHLDLKRRRGADPSEVARLEQEALGPVRRDPAPAEPADDHNDESHAHESTADAEPHAGHPHPASEGLHPDDRTHVLAPEDRHEPPHGDPLFEQHAHNEEVGGTAAREPEELGGAAASAPEPSADDADRAGGDENARPAAEGRTGARVGADPGPARQAAEPEHEGQQAQDPRHSDIVDQPTTEYRVEDHHDEDEHEASAAHGGPDEDVLEETPDFLQETPEHDRLWFEQRPPRDFDFDG
ncbi:MAG TPA: hypothetical protein VGO48_12065 [Conexibacter sp.]|jgi:hypothetical protein|nr:hypothetical protein [Conexibacter sp.]